MAFLFSQQFIAILGDFYLEKNSPLVGFSEKKHSMGNRYVEPDFNALLQTIAHMVQRAQIQTQTNTIPFSSLGRQGYPLYPLSENDWKVLTFRDFYEKTMKGKYNSQAIGVIIQQLGFENEVFCYHITDIILKGVNKASFDDSKSYLEAMVYFLNILDFLQIKRIEWVLGFPQPTITTATNALDSFGVYGNSSIEDFVVTYETPLTIEGGTSIINYMLQNRRRLENITLICLKNLLTLANINQAVFEYILFLPPPSNNFAKFTDWIPLFFDFYYAESKKYSYTSYHKEDLINETVKIWKTLEAKIEARLDINDKINGKLPETKKETQLEIVSESTTIDQPSSLPKEEGAQVVPLRALNQTYIIGQTIKEEQIDRMLLSQPEDADEVYLQTTEVTCYITESKPTGKGNLAFPERLLQDGKFRNEYVDENSSEVYFVKPKSVNFSNNETNTEQNKVTDDVEASIQEKEGRAGDEAEFIEENIQG